MVLEANKIFVPESAEVIRDDILTDIRLEMRNQGVTNPAVQPGTDNFILATAMSNAGMLQYSNISIHDDDRDVFVATEDPLDRLRQSYGLPEVTASPSTGAIVPSISGAATIIDGTEFVLPNGLRGKVSGNFVGLTDGDEVDVVTIDTGSDTELPPGAIVRFVNPPLNVDTEARVSFNRPLTGGQDEETDDRKRERILNRLQNVPAGGNTGFIRELAFNALASVQNVFVYPALGGPGSAKIVPVKDFDVPNLDFTRSFDSAGLQIIRDAVHAEMPSPMELITQAASETDLNIGIRITIPDSSLSGGNGQGWLDQVVWPDLVGGDSGIVTVTTVTSPSVIIVSANTAVSPTAGQTHIAWWSSVDRRFRTFLVTAVSGGSGAWTLTLEKPLVDSTGLTGVAVGEYISPGATNMESYGKQWLTSTRALGTGENTADASRLPRSARHPFEADGPPSGITITQLCDLKNTHKEITEAAYSVTVPTLTVPALVATAPPVFVPLQFGIWQT